jgi:hypothetical protein
MARIHEVTWNFDWRHVKGLEVGQSSRLAADEMRAISSISNTVVLSSSLIEFIELEPQPRYKDGWRIAAEFAGCKNAIVVTRRMDTTPSLGYTSPITSTAPLYTGILQFAPKTFSSQQPLFMLSAIPTSSSTLSSSEDIIYSQYDFFKPR